MALCNMKHDGPRLDQREIAFLICQNLPEGWKRLMRGLLHGLERDEVHVVRLADFLKRPTHADALGQSLAIIRRVLKSSNSRRHRNTSKFFS